MGKSGADGQILVTKSNFWSPGHWQGSGRPLAGFWQATGRVLLLRGRRDRLSGLRSDFFQKCREGFPRSLGALGAPGGVVALFWLRYKIDVAIY